MQRRLPAHLGATVDVPSPVTQRPDPFSALGLIELALPNEQLACVYAVFDAHARRLGWRDAVLSEDIVWA